jgi:predicted dehydrogenase/Tfp pilus assembly protein PilF
MLNGAIVGFGNVARHGHWPAYEQSRSLRIVALVDPHLARQTGHHDLPVYPSITLAASDRRLDFVDICAPPAWHTPLVLEALSLNLHAIVEKPLALTMDDFDEVARTALARSRIVLPVHNWRHAPALQQASAALRRGDIGALRSAEIDVWRPAACGSADSPAWRQNRAVAGGGIVLDHGWHAFYLMMEWFGGRPDTVDGWCHAEPPQDVETDADITLGFAGRTGVIRLTWRGPRRRNRVLLTGDAGSIEIDDDLYVITNDDGEDRRRTASLSEGSYHPDWFPHVLTDFERTLGDRAAAARVLDEAGACVQIADRVYNAALRRRSGQATSAVAGRSWIATLLALCLWVACQHPLAAQIDPRTALLERAGFDALNRGQARAAADIFREAIAADPKNAMLHLGAAMAAVLERRDGDAKDELERALALDKTLTGARVLLGQVQYRMGDRIGAMRTYETVVVEVPDNAEAQATLARWRREAELHDRMQQAVGSHFTVSFEGPAEAALAAAALESLDKAYWRIGELLGTYPSDPIGVVLYTTEQFRDVTRSPTWAAGAYDGTIRVPMRGALDNPAELDRVLAHEFTHALVRTLATRGVPAWLNEGLAAALERAGGDPASALSDGAPVPLTALTTGFGRLSGSDAQRAYATSALAAQRLLDEAGGFAVANLLRDLGRGEEFNAAFLHRIQRSFADFQAAMF